MNIIPNNSRRRGKLIFSKAFLKPDYIDSLSQDELINSRPTKIIPKPINKLAIFINFLIKANITPMKQNRDKYKEILKLSKEAKSPVVVVPIFAPIIIAAA